MNQKFLIWCVFTLPNDFFLSIPRSKFNEIWQKMVTKLELGKKLIMDLIEQSVAAYEQREELCNKLQNLEGKSQNEQNLHLQVQFQ